MQLPAINIAFDEDRDKLQQNIEDMKTYTIPALTRNTQLAFMRDMNAFERWLGVSKLDVLQVAFKDAEAFIGQQFYEGLRVRSVMDRVTHIVKLYECLFVGMDRLNPFADRRIKEILTRAKHQAMDDGTWLKKQSKPFKGNDVKTYLRLADIEYERSGELRLIADMSMIAVGYSTMFRSAELAKLRAEDVTRGRVSSIQSRVTKNGKSRRGYLMKPCLEVLDKYLDRVGNKGGEVSEFIWPHFDVRHGILWPERASHREVPSDAVQRACRFVCLDPKGFSAHSLRVGATQDLTMMNQSLPRIQLAGGWDDPRMPAYYASQISVGDSAMADLERQLF